MMCLIQFTSLTNTLNISKVRYKNTVEEIGGFVLVLDFDIYNVRQIKISESSSFTL